jgi:energy-coupling factor transport system substrate-specific component
MSSRAVDGSGRGPAALVPVRLRSAVALAAVFVVGIAAFGWPFVVEPGSALDSSHSGDAPLVFVVLLPLLAAVVLAELTSGGMDAKSVAMLGMLAAVGGALRALGPGTAGLEPTFVVLVLGGRVFGRGFGFVLGAVTLFVGALITGGVGPWLPFQMLAAGWVGFFAGTLPPARGRAEVLLLAGYSAVVSLVFGMVMNLWFWPFASYGPEVSYVAGDSVLANAGRYALFYVTTSLPWDIGRAALCLVVVLLAGSALLRALRRASRRAAFDVPVVFEPRGPRP